MSHPAAGVTTYVSYCLNTGDSDAHACTFAYATESTRDGALENGERSKRSGGKRQRSYLSSVWLSTLTKTEELDMVPMEEPP